MPSHTYYIDIGEGFLDSNLKDIRKKAIDYLWDNREKATVVVYTSATRKKEVGRITYTGSWPIFVWKPSRGRSCPLRKDGTIKR